MPRDTVAAMILALAFGSHMAARPARGGEPQPVAGVDLSGRWTYDVQASDDARQKMREGMEGRGGPRGGGPPGGPGGGGGGGGMGGRAAPESPAK